MKKLLIIGNLLWFSVALHAQSDYFVFIQTDNNQPFYVQTNGKTLSSSLIGHLIISGLKDSVYLLNVGFPKGQYPEQSFQLRINKRDAGYQLKNMGAEGWALFNLQTLELIKSQQSETKKAAINYGDVKKTDVFSTLMAGLVNDSAVLYTSIAKVEPKKEETKTVVSDSQPLPNEIVGPVTTQRVDSPAAAVIIDKKVDSTSPANTPTAPGDLAVTRVELPIRDTARADKPLLKPAPNESAAKAIDSPQTSTPTLSVDDSSRRADVIVSRQPVKSANDSPAVAQDSVALPVGGKPKSLIVWLSETKTAAGTELVYYDLSVPERTDTIRILIPKEESVQPIKAVNETKPGAVDSSSASEKKGSVFGRLFRKKQKAQPDKNTESSIKVTTVEEKKPEPKVAKENRSVKQTQSDPVAPGTNDEKTEKKERSGSFLGRIFGNKEKATPADERDTKVKTEKSSTVTVTDAGASKKPEPATASHSGGDPEVERLKKAQEQEEKTGTERFFGKLFRKKSDEKAAPNSRQDASSSSIKVTTVEPSAEGNAKQANSVNPTNSDCRQFASIDDVDRLRVRMLMEKDPDGQIVEARKTFRGRCFTTDQVKSLSTLFRTDEGRYKLFDAAYPFVSDSRNFKTLVSLLTDPYYINRFKAMVRM